MNIPLLARGLAVAVLLASVAACGGGSGLASASQELAMNPVAADAKSVDVPTPSLRCAP